MNCAQCKVTLTGATGRVIIAGTGEFCSHECVDAAQVRRAMADGTCPRCDGLDGDTEPGGRLGCLYCGGTGKL